MAAKKTPLYDSYVDLGGKIVDFAAFDMTVSFEGIVAEHERLWCRHQSMTLPEHEAAAKQLRWERIGLVRPARNRPQGLRSRFAAWPTTTPPSASTATSSPTRP